MTKVQYCPLCKGELHYKSEHTTACRECGAEFSVYSGTNKGVIICPKEQK